jgi:hypothetical protein
VTFAPPAGAPAPGPETRRLGLGDGRAPDGARVLPAELLRRMKQPTVALQAWLGVTDRDPQPLPYDPARAAELVGSYQLDAMTATIASDGTRLRLAVRIKPELRAAADKELPPDIEPSDVGLLPGDEYVITSGALTGQRGFFTRDHRGAVVGIDLAGRFARRVATPSGG